MPFIKAKNGNVVELAEDLVEEFLAQGHEGPFATEADVVAGRVTPAETTGIPVVVVPIEPTEPRGNGSREEWAAWADHLGVEYEPDAKRDDIKAAVDAAVEEV
jgi:hypothetical protein